MRWPEISLAIAALIVAATAAPAANAGFDPGASFGEAIERRLAALGQTEKILDEKIAARRDLIEARVRGFYKLSRAGGARAWIDRSERATAPRRRAAMRLLLRRELSELELLRRERALAKKARVRLEGDREARPASAPEPGALFRPVVDGRIARGFGEYQEDESGARLMSRGVEFATFSGRNVRAVARGRVLWVGELRGLGRAVVAEHRAEGARFTSVLGRLTDLAVEAEDKLERGQKLGEAAGDRVYLEIRLPSGAAGFPIDPAPLMTP